MPRAVHYQPLQCALQHINTGVELARNRIYVLAIDRRDERQIELLEYPLVDFIRQILEPEYLVDALK